MIHQVRFHNQTAKNKMWTPLSLAELISEAANPDPDITVEFLTEPTTQDCEHYWFATTHGLIVHVKLPIVPLELTLGWKHLAQLDKLEREKKLRFLRMGRINLVHLLAIKVSEVIGEEIREESE